MKLLPSHRDHLHKSGLTDKTTAAAGIYSVTDPVEAARLLNWQANGPAPAIAFPNFGGGGEVFCTILRPDTPHVREDGSAPKYEAPRGSEPRLYFPPALVVSPDAWADRDKPLLLVEGIKKALAAAQAGALAISAQGVTVWHDISFKKEMGRYRLHPDFEGIPLRERVVFIAFDGGDTSSNAPVVAAEARLGRMLLNVGADVRLLRIPFEPGGPKIGLDDYLAGLAAPAEALAKLLAEAIPADPILRVQGLDGRSDKILAAQQLLKDWSFAAALREADRTTFDLVAAELRRLTKITKAAVEEAIERFTRQLRPPSNPKESIAPAAHPPELIKKAEELLLDPKLLNRFHASVARDGVVGERKATTTILLAAVTRKTKRPVHLVLKAASSSGKNHVVKHVVARLPVEDVLEVTDMSPRALEYLPGSLKGKVVVIAEHEGAERAEYSLRIVMSEGSLSILTAEKVSDAEGSRIESRKHVVEGPCSVITTTTRSSLHDENETRVLEVTLDETPEQTRRIIDAHALRARQPPSQTDEKRAAEERDLWRCALGLLTETETINPFAPKLAATFPTSRVRARRDFLRLLDLASAHALLHQRQRQFADGRVVVAEEDVAAAQKLCQALFSDVSLRLRMVATKLWARFGTSEFTPAEASKALGDSIDDARRLLREMGDAELAECIQEHKGSKPSRWKLAGEPDSPTEPDFEPCRTNSAETTRETTEPDSPTAGIGRTNGAGTERPGGGDQQPPSDPGRAVGQIDFGNDSTQVTPTDAKVGQGRAVGQDSNGGTAPEQSTTSVPPPSPPGPVNGSKTAAFIIEVLPGETEAQAEARWYAGKAARRIAAADRAEAQRLRVSGQLEEAKKLEESAAEAERSAAP